MSFHINTCKCKAVLTLAKVTRNDVARLAGVSPAVVSYVLNNSNYVSEEKRAAVLEAAKTLNYSPNRFAKGLRTNRSSSIALIGDSLQTELFESLAVRLFNKGYYASLFYSQLNDMFIRRIIDGQFDSVFMTSNGFSSQQLNRIVDSGTPMILYKSREYQDLSPKIVTMAPDFYDGVHKAMDYLILKGHRRVAYIPPLRYRTKGLGGDDFRIRAYTQALRDNGLPEDAGLVCTTTETIAQIEGAVLHMVQDRPQAQRPTAMLVGDDDLAAQLIQYLRTLNLSVPEDIAVMGWGNIPIARITSPQLTTVDGDVKEFAACMAEALVQLATGRRPEEKIFPVHLVLRTSA